MNDDVEVTREDILQVFAVEAKEQLDLLEDGLLKLEQDPGDPEVLAELFRAAHSLKGNASVVDLTSIEAFTHTLEDVFDRIRSGSITPTSDLVSLLLRVVDAFRRIIPKALAGIDDPHPEHAELLRWLASPARDSSAVAESTSDLSQSTVDDGSRNRTLRVDAHKLDRMLDLLGEITIARSRLSSLLGLADVRSLPVLRDARDAHDDAEELYRELQSEVLRSRLVRLGPTFRRYQRVVRDLALASGKHAHLVIDGEDAEVDLAVVEAIRDPLTHMIRNAVDHGIEPPALRAAKGKPEIGTIVVRATREGSSVAISVADDGAGLDREQVLARARAMKLVAADEVPSDSNLFKLIFEPGFSTAKIVSEVSGRGIGMSVVQRNIEALRGTVLLSSHPGRGTTVTLRLPLTLAIIEGFSVGVGTETYVLPMDAVLACVEMPEAERTTDDAQGLIDVWGRPIPYVRLANLLGVERSPANRESVVILQHDGDRAGVVVDDLCGASQTVIKPLADLVDRIPAVAGCTLLGSGRVALILDVPALFEAAASGTSSAQQVSEP
ncbi:MAG TPA: chemotaxis protein CheA [Kofleriaceae bacterium]|nr:chemotaxis protein CheA [Kofleriaceae bacterium]